jgi:hypothetical protein
VTITEDPSARTTTVVADGRTEVFDHLFSHYDLELGSKMDELTFALAGTQAMTGRHLDVLANLGTGENHFTFNPPQADGEPADIFNQSDVNLNVIGHNGNDFVSLNFDDITESRVNVNVHGIGGTQRNSPGNADSITFGHAGEIAEIRNSSVNVNVGLGNGNIDLAFNYGVTLGNFTNGPGPTRFGPANMTVNITGSSRSRDLDKTRPGSWVVKRGVTANRKRGNLPCPVRVGHFRPRGRAGKARQTSGRKSVQMCSCLGERLRLWSVPSVCRCVTPRGPV